MKTAISLPDRIFAAADALAERLGISRSLDHLEQYLTLPFSLQFGAM